MERVGPGGTLPLRNALAWHPLAWHPLAWHPLAGYHLAGSACTLAQLRILGRAAELARRRGLIHLLASRLHALVVAPGRQPVRAAGAGPPGIPGCG